MVVGGLIVYPGFYAVYLSTLNKTQTKFIGLGNYAFLFSRETFWGVVEQSCIFAVTAVILKALIGIVTAHLVNNLPSKGQRKWRGMLLIPWVIPLSLSTLGSALAGCSIPPTAPSTGSWPRSAGRRSPAQRAQSGAVRTILVNVWFGAPFFLIMYLAALKSVPEQLYEAAAIDGANAWQKLIHITLPMMRNIIAITVLFSLIVTVANYDIVRVLTSVGRATPRISSPPGPSSSALPAATFPSAPRCRCSWFRSSASPPSSSCAASAAAERKSDERGRRRACHAAASPAAASAATGVGRWSRPISSSSCSPSSFSSRPTTSW